MLSLWESIKEIHSLMFSLFSYMLVNIVETSYIVLVKRVETYRAENKNIVETLPRNI